jgi:nucleotide-binding universal stress UspA family protein
MRTKEALEPTRELGAQETPRSAVVVGVDGSPGSVAALKWAAREARLRGLVLRVVTAYHWELPPVPGPAVSLDVDVLRDAARATQDEALDAAADHLAGVVVERELAFGGAGACLSRAAEDAELLVVGSHGHGPLGRLMVGSVGHDVVQHARCPVVVLPHPRPAAHGGDVRAVAKGRAVADTELPVALF